MKKNELVAAIADKAGCTKKDAEVALKAVFEVCADALAEGDKISVQGFGTFSVKETNARTGINPSTGEKVEIAAGKKVVFKAASALKDSLK